MGKKKNYTCKIKMTNGSVDCPSTYCHLLEEGFSEEELLLFLKPETSNSIVANVNN